MSKRICFYGECMPIPRTFVRDEITTQPKKRDPELEAKLARVVALLEKLVAEDRPAADVMAAKKRQRQANARRLRNTDSMKFLQDTIRQAAYEAVCESRRAARNPHKPRKRELWEERLATTDSGSRFLLICEQSEAAYAARNPHKR